ncbi:ABC transporter permease [Desulfosarcina cetonica]|uniref:ABC transporter permease n=1 Tax=Desulfosarcina cetonica TaxID=90730 RepID=UPI001FEE64C3|nr:hypothetical protein [Desulfosarcina cetonica]
MKPSRPSGALFYLYGIGILLFLYLPIVAVGFASVSKARYLRFPIHKYATGWYVSALESDTVAGLVATSLTIAGIVTIVSVVIGFFGALAFARYQWRFRRIYQKLILLPIFSPRPSWGWPCSCGSTPLASFPAGTRRSWPIWCGSRPSSP